MSINQFRPITNHFQGALPQKAVSTVASKYSAVADRVTFSGQTSPADPSPSDLIAFAHNSAIEALAKLKNGELADITVVNQYLNEWKAFFPQGHGSGKPKFYLPTVDFLKGIQAPGLDLSGMRLGAKDEQGWDVVRVDLSGANLEGANFKDAYLSSLIFKKANLTRANLTDANLTETDLSEANLSNANLTRANLSGAGLKGTNLLNARVDGANIAYAIDDIV